MIEREMTLRLLEVVSKCKQLGRLSICISHIFPFKITDTHQDDLGRTLTSKPPITAPIIEDIWDKVFKSGRSKFCGRQPLKNLKGYSLLQHQIYLNTSTPSRLSESIRYVTTPVHILQRPAQRK